MILHIGNGKTVRQRDIIGIFDMDTASLSRTSRAFLSRAEKEGCVFAADADIPRSFVLCRTDGQKKIYLSHISPVSLCARTDAIQTE